MRAAILNIGTELLMGMTVNTNSAFLSEKLNELGISVLYHVVVGDNPDRIREAIRTYLDKSDVVVTTGGLGPTLDDITKEVVAESLELKMVYHEDQAELLRQHFIRMNRPMTDNNYRQAWFPEGSVLMENKRGTAPGCITAKGEKAVLMFPGPPRELIPMFENQARSWLEARSGNKITSLFLKSFGLGESSLESLLMDLIEGQENPTLATYVKNSEVTLRITAAGPSEKENLALIKPVAEEVERRIGAHIFASQNLSMEEVVVNLMTEKGLTLSTAESCTGGMIAQTVTAVPGSSKVLDRALVTYSNQAKMDELGVTASTLEAHGAVSRQTAIEMVKGLMNKAKTDFALSVTGIAGPDGGTAEKPVGLVYMAVAFKEAGLLRVICREFKFTGDRERIRLYTVMNALDWIRRLVLGERPERRMDVVPWESQWRHDYQEEAKRIHEALSEIQDLQLYHGGSTSVEGLPSKPIIDLLGAIDDLSLLDSPEVIGVMNQLGYVAHGELGIPNRRFFTKDVVQEGQVPERRRTHHMHVFLKDSAELFRHLAFKAYLEEHEDVRQAYAELKENLAVIFRYDNESYCAGKDGWIKETEERALIWGKDRKNQLFGKK